MLLICTILILQVAVVHVQGQAHTVGGRVGADGITSVTWPPSCLGVDASDTYAVTDTASTSWLFQCGLGTNNGATGLVTQPAANSWRDCFALCNSNVACTSFTYYLGAKNGEGAGSCVLKNAIPGAFSGSNQLLNTRIGVLKRALGKFKPSIFTPTQKQSLHQLIFVNSLRKHCTSCVDHEHHHLSSAYNNHERHHLDSGHDHHERHYLGASRHGDHYGNGHDRSDSNTDLGRYATVQTKRSLTDHFFQTQTQTVQGIPTTVVTTIVRRVDQVLTVHSN